jgi:holo-[acyl-carrier protein] synthase
VGVDLVEVARVDRLLAEHPVAAERLFTPRERSQSRGGAHLAGRFAAKEAVLKALGTGLGPGMRWTDVEIVRGARGRPLVELHGEVAALARRRRLQDVDVSLTHSAGVAIANAVVVWDPPCAST